MDQYRFLLTRSDWSQTDVRFQDENSRCLLWRRMSSNRAVHPLMKPTGRQRHRNQSLHSPTHLTWLERLNWRARDCGCNSSRRCCCRLGSLLHQPPAVLKWFSIEGFSVLCQLQDRMPWPMLKWGSFSRFMVGRKCLFWWGFFRSLSQDQLNVYVPRFFTLYELEHSAHDRHGGQGHCDISESTNPNLFL